MSELAARGREDGPVADDLAEGGAKRVGASRIVGAFAVVVSVNEFVVSLFISNRVTEILSVAMLNYVVNYTDPNIAALSSLFIAATFLVVWLADRYLNLGRVFLQH